MNALLAHGGGPTSVINASLAGLVEESRSLGIFGSLYGARSGVRGILNDEVIDLLQIDPAVVLETSQSPGSALGSSREKISHGDYSQILRNLDRRNIHCFFYTGGNGSMDTALEIARFAKASGYPLQVIGIPKTIDNDLCITDHTPGYPSAAHFFALAARDVGEDNRSLPSPVCVLEVLGRNAGWIVAATALARKHDDDAPHLIYFPERRVSFSQIAADTERIYRRLGRVVIAICEGQLDETGSPFGAEVDRATSSVHRLASNLGHTLSRLITAELGMRARSEKPGLFGRCCGPLSCDSDRAEAWECGRSAALAAADRHSGVMVALRREYSVSSGSATFLTPLETVARIERFLPDQWISAEGNDVTPEFIDYVSPLLPAIKSYPRL